MGGDLRSLRAIICVLRSHGTIVGAECGVFAIERVDILVLSMTTILLSRLT